MKRLIVVAIYMRSDAGMFAVGVNSIRGYWLWFIFDINAGFSFTF